jgi:hypothetical protein
MQRAAEVAVQFGVTLDQVRRDHLISLALAAIEPLRDQMVFFGGTALARSYLVQGRLSEDIDLIATGSRTDTADALAHTLDRALRPTHGRLTWSRPLREVRDTDPVTISTDDGISLRIQLLRSGSYPPWPIRLTQLHQRYSDVPPASLHLPTRDAFVGWKTTAWIDRRAPRDLWDLWALATMNALTASAAQLFAEHGPTSKPPRSWMFAKAPTQREWHEQLAGQTKLTIDADSALATVRDAWMAATGEKDEPTNTD